MVQLSAQEMNELEQAVAGLRVGSEKAYECIYKLLFVQLVTYSAMIISDKEFSLQEYREISKDIVSQVLQTVWFNKKDFSSATGLFSYLKFSVKNKSLSYIRDRRKDRKKHRLQADLNVQDSTIDNEYAAAHLKDENWERVLLHYNIAKEIQKLSPPEYRMLSLRLEGKEMAEIAEEMNITLNYAWNLQSRGLKSLRKLSKSAHLPGNSLSPLLLLLYIGILSSL